MVGQFTRVFFIALGIAILLNGYQNCSGPGAGTAASNNGVKVTCVPSDKACLNFKLSLANLSSTKGSMSVLMQGSVDEGVSNDTTFSTNCNRVNNSTAYCPFNQTVSGTINSDSTTTTVKGDGRSLVVSVFTNEAIKSEKHGDLSKIGTEELPCLISPETEFNDGDFIPWDSFSECE